MKKFLIKIVSIALPFLAIALIMEVLLRAIPNDYVLKKEFLNKGSNNIETLILGSSHSYYGLNPTFFSSNTFNAGYISQTLDYDYEILKKYQSKFKKLKTIILPISYFSFYEKLEATEEFWRIKNYIIYFDMDTAKSFINHTEILSLPVKTNLKRLIDYYILDKPSITSTKLGWGSNFTSENAKDLIKSGEPRARVNTYINKPNYKLVFNANTITINEIVAWCNNRNIRLLLLTTPAFETYCQNLDKEQLNVTIKKAETLDLKNKNCNYLNLLKDDRFDAKDFYDADHLSDIGAEKLSKLINEKVSNWQ